MLKNKSKKLHLPIRDLSKDLPHLANLVNKSLLTNCLLEGNPTNANFKGNMCSKTVFSKLGQRPRSQGKNCLVQTERSLHEVSICEVSASYI